MSWSWAPVLALAIAGPACSRPAAPATTPTGPTGTPTEGTRASLTSDDPVVAATEIVALARAGERTALEQVVDWELATKLARVSGAFDATVDDLIRTASLDATCTPTWTTGEGGDRLDFPPAMVDDPDDIAAEKDAVKAELYQGVDVVASCDGHEQLVLQLVRGANGSWIVRGWGQL